jgi:hypothetical protein
MNAQPINRRDVWLRSPDVIALPDLSLRWEYENNFYLSCDVTRISKILAHYELFKMTNELPGAVVECGVFKGASLVRFAAFRDLLGSPYSRAISPRRSPRTWRATRSCGSRSSTWTPTSTSPHG